METKLARIAEVARTKPKERFTTLAHLLNEDMLRQCHQELKSRKAPGVDGVTKAEYEKNLEENLKLLVERMKRQAYKPQPVRRVNIPKEGSHKTRPLGIPAYEDKLVQMALSKILNAIYEEDFLGCSFGCRPGRSCHDALKVLNHVIEQKGTNYVVDADIKGFFDHVDHQWLIKFLQHRIADPNILRLIARILKAGVMEAGMRYDTPEGTPQGGVVSPVLANIYLHYVLDLWFEKVARRKCNGNAYMVRYADDFVCCFELEDDAHRFYRALIERLKKFNLEIAEEKTRIISFGRKAAAESKQEGKGKPGTFDFLGFTHYCGQSRLGKFRVKRKTSKKKMRASITKCNQWLKRCRNLPVKELMYWIRIRMLGTYRYYGVTDNYPALRAFRDKVERMLYKWLNRRSQRKSFGWDKYKLFLKRFPLPQPTIYVSIYNFRPGLMGNLL